jgi:hypothetical protein
VVAGRARIGVVRRISVARLQLVSDYTASFLTIAAVIDWRT